jgi:hypothetical protein
VSGQVRDQDGRLVTTGRDFLWSFFPDQYPIPDDVVAKLQHLFDTKYPA